MGNIREDDLGIKNYKIYQDFDAYSFTGDSIRLSNFVNCKNKDTILELCAGCGIVSIHKFAENEQNLDKGRGKFFLIELQKALFDVLEKNINVNNLQDVFVPINDDLKNTFQYVKKATFDVVICNPPYEKESAGFKKKNQSDMIARAEITTNFNEIAKVAGSALKYGGAFYFICKSERLFEISNILNENGMKIKVVHFVLGKNRFRLALVKAVLGANDGVEFSVHSDCGNVDN